MTLLTTALVSLASFVGADEGTKEAIAPQQSNNHRVYAGPEFMWSHLHNLNSYYGGLRFGYEYLKPDAFYAATDAVALLGSDRVSFGDKVIKGHHAHFWSNAEQRFGYTFSSSLVPTCTVSVFAGPGFHYEHVKGFHGLWGYAHLGLKAVQQFTDHFSLGTEVKVMHAFAANESLLTFPTTLGKSHFWGYEAAVPFKWTVGEKGSFDIQFKPYVLKLNASSPQTILGTRLELGYAF